MEKTPPKKKTEWRRTERSKTLYVLRKKGVQTKILPENREDRQESETMKVNIQFEFYENIDKDISEAYTKICKQIVENLGLTISETREKGQIVLTFRDFCTTKVDEKAQHDIYLSINLLQEAYRILGLDNSNWKKFIATYSLCYVYKLFNEIPRELHIQAARILLSQGYRNIIESGTENLRNIIDTGKAYEAAETLLKLSY